MTLRPVSSSTSGDRLGKLLKRGAALNSQANHMLEASDHVRSRVLADFKDLRADMVDRELGRIPLVRLKDVTEGRLRLDALSRAHYRTILDVYGSRPSS